MKKLLFLLLFPCFALAQYQNNGNQKITLGEQSTADGLIWRGVLNDTALITPFSDTSAYIILDTVSNRFFHYKRNTNVWTVAGGSDTSLIAYVNTYGTQTVNGAKTLTSNLILKNSQEPVRDTFVGTQSFAADTSNWTRGTGWTFSSGVAVATSATGDLTYTPSLTVTSGNAYEITYTLTSYTGGTLSVILGNGAAIALPTYNVTGYAVLTLPTNITGGFRFTTSSFTGSLDNVRIIQITGSAPVLFAGQDDGAATLYSSLRMPNISTFAFGGGGARTTGLNNVFLGSNSGLENTTGDGNIFIGSLSGSKNTTGLYNTFFGFQAGQNNIIGSSNVFAGYRAGQLNTTGSNNFFFGLETGQNNSIGSNNVFIATQSGKNNTLGNNNVFFGQTAGFDNSTGSNNNFIGLNAGRSNKTGSFNVALGNNALYNTTVGDTLTGSSNIAIGTNAGDNIRFAAAGNVVIGNGIDLPDPSGSHQLVIKNIIFATGASGASASIAGSVGIGTNAPTAGYRLTVADSVYVGGRVSAAGYTTRSDYDLKDEIQSLNYGLNEVIQMQPVKYTYKSNGEQQLGFIAQDIGTLIPESVHFDSFMGVDYQSIIPILTKAIQQQQAQIEALKQRLLILENK